MQRRQHSTTGKSILLILACILYSAFNGIGQISPGDLSRPHAHLEGILNCTKCHVLGDKVTNEKCLECHKEIKSRLDQKKGYHASSEVQGKDCFVCHSDHHGRNFEIVRFDAAGFNHEYTGYTLTGAHQELDCKACHKDELIESQELRKKTNTYLGLKTNCIDCHRDVHQNTLSKDCASCHSTEAFEPATFFNHSKTEFTLKGKHQDVDCRNCHPVTFSNSTTFQQFAGIPFNSCAECHEDVHQGRFGANCKECHTEVSFSTFTGKSSFNHNETDFPLKGKHVKVNCASCHEMEMNTGVDNIFQDYKNQDVTSCLTCHEDVHETKFGADCKKCHSEESFQKILLVDPFDHDPTGYPLEGKHVLVDCRKCHETRFIDPIEHDRCLNCHDDFHEGQFVQMNYTPDCADCHNVEGFTESSYTIERHNESRFPLAGAHLATPCVSCHRKNEEWSFNDIGMECIDCHTDVHEGFIREQYYPQKDCSQCHQPESWALVSFDHGLTGFELEGRHENTSCVKCHQQDINQKETVQIPFTGLKTECTTCHENIHDRQFEVEGKTDCRRCHDFEHWKPSTFDHNSARFKLDGAHVHVSCQKCHKEEEVEGKKVIKYKLEQFECARCHM